LRVHLKGRRESSKRETTRKKGEKKKVHAPADSPTSGRHRATKNFWKHFSSKAREANSGTKGGGDENTARQQPVGIKTSLGVERYEEKSAPKRPESEGPSEKKDRFWTFKRVA